MKTKILFALVVATLFGGTTTAVAAGSCANCKITRLGSGPYFDALCASGSCIFVSMNQDPVNRLACADNTGWHFVLDTSTSAGKATYSLLLSAHATGQIVTIAGANSCSTSPSGHVENFHYIVTYQ